MLYFAALIFEVLTDYVSSVYLPVNVVGFTQQVPEHVCFGDWQSERLCAQNKTKHTSTLAWIPAS